MTKQTVSVVRRYTPVKQTAYMGKLLHFPIHIIKDKHIFSIDKLMDVDTHSDHANEINFEALKSKFSTMLGKIDGS